MKVELIKVELVPPPPPEPEVVVTMSRAEAYEIQRWIGPIVAPPDAGVELYDGLSRALRVS